MSALFLRTSGSGQCDASHRIVGSVRDSAREGPRDRHVTSPKRRFPPPWSVEETDACFIVGDANVQALAYVYFEDELGRRGARNSSRATTRHIAANIAKPPVLLRRNQ